MSAKDASSYFANIMNAYETLAVYVPSFEKRIYSILFSTIKSNESKRHWFLNISVRKFMLHHPLFLMELLLRMVKSNLVCKIRKLL